MRTETAKKSLFLALLTGIMLMIFCLLPQNCLAVSAGWKMVSDSAGCEWQISDSVLTIRPLDNGESGYLENLLPGNYTNWPWYVKQGQYKTIEIAKGVKARGSLYGMFYGSSAETAHLANLDTSLATDMKSMFENCKNLKTLDVSGWDTSNVTDMFCLFLSCSKLQSLDLSSWNTSAVTDMSFMFSSCREITDIKLPDQWDTSNVTNMRYMLCDCENLASLDTSKWDTAKVTSMQQMFTGCTKLTTLDVSGWDTALVTNMEEMFRSCSSLQSLNLSSWNTAKVTNMNYMFFDCSKLSSLTFSEAFDTSSVTAMTCMFQGCSSLKALSLPENFTPCKITNLIYFFSGCSSLESLSLPESFDTSNVTNTIGMFYNCSSLKSLSLPEAFDTSKVENMSGMFGECTSLQTLSLPEAFDTSNVQDMSLMFCDCSSLQTLTLPSAFTPAKATNMTAMFMYDSSLTSIYVDDTRWSASPDFSADMFDGCKKLVGGRGTSYKSKNVDVSYAVVDYGAENPGYLSKHDQPLTFGEITEDVLFKVRNDAPFTIVATGAVTPVTYASSNPAVASVDSATGTVTILAAGTTVISAASPETGTLYPGATSYTLVVYADAQSIPSSSSEDLAAISRHLADENPGSTVNAWLNISLNVSSEAKQAFRNKTNGCACSYYQAVLYASVDGEVSDIGSSNDILIHVTNKFVYQSGKELHVYRLHGTAVDELTETPNADGEYVTFDTANNRLIVVAKKYSVFCLAVKTIPPKTGDETNLWLYAGMGVLSLLGLTVLGIAGKKRRG